MGNIFLFVYCIFYVINFREIYFCFVYFILLCNKFLGNILLLCIFYFLCNKFLGNILSFCILYFYVINFREIYFYFVNFIVLCNNFLGNVIFLCIILLFYVLNCEMPKSPQAVHVCRLAPYGWLLSRCRSSFGTTAAYRRYGLIWTANRKAHSSH